MARQKLIHRPDTDDYMSAVYLVNLAQTKPHVWQNQICIRDLVNDWRYVAASMCMACVFQQDGLISAREDVVRLIVEPKHT